MNNPYVTDADGGSPKHWTGWRAGRLFVPVDKQRLFDVLAHLDSRPSPGTYRWRLLWFRTKCVLRIVGMGGAGIAFATVIITLLLGTIAAFIHWSLPAQAVKVMAEVVVTVILVGVAAWVYFFLGVITFDLSTSFARHASETLRHIPKAADGWLPSTGYSFAAASGSAAKALFRALTGRRINVTLRPDVAERATAVAERILVAVPKNGTAGLAMRTRTAHHYAALMHDINALIAIGRVDLVPTAIDASWQEHSYADFAVNPGSPEIARYLHPLGRRTVLDAVAAYVVPALALAVSLLAAAISAYKP